MQRLETQGREVKLSPALSSHEIYVAKIFSGLTESSIYLQKLYV